MTCNKELQYQFQCILWEILPEGTVVTDDVQDKLCRLMTAITQVVVDKAAAVALESGRRTLREKIVVAPAQAPRSAAGKSKAKAATAAATTKARKKRATGKAQEVYKVEAILGHRKVNGEGEEDENGEGLEFRVHWKGYSVRESTWEDKEGLVKGCKLLLDAYSQANDLDL